MSVIVEFTCTDGVFPFGRMFTDSPGMTVELEAIVPTETAIVPYLWVNGDQYETFETRVRQNEYVAEFVALDRLEDVVLYRIDWMRPSGDLLEGIEVTEGVVLEASRNEGWTFRLRFSTHDNVSQFYNYCTRNNVTIDISRSFTLTEKTEFGYQFDLSQEQREALLLGLQHGYFDTPSQTTLEELAAELDISSQALSNRIRRGTKQVLGEALLSTTAGDFD